MHEPLLENSSQMKMRREVQRMENVELINCPDLVMQTREHQNGDLVSKQTYSHTDAGNH